ncbi:MAG: TrbI/VirB10 family protein [Francisellaceae bacterium]
MAKKKQQKFSLRESPPKTSELNKKLIAIAGGAIVLIILIAFIFSINTQQSSTDTESVDLAAGGSAASPPRIGSELASYSDAEAIQKKLGMDQPVKVVERADPKLQQMIDEQKNQLTALQSQLTSLQNQQNNASRQNSNNRDQSLSPMDREAMNAPIFFGGGAPRPLPDKDQDEQKGQQAADKSQGGKETAEQQREKFMQGGETAKDITNQNTIQEPISDNVVMAGTTIPAILQTKIISTLPGTIVARVDHDVYDSLSGRVLLIPRGSSIIGQYNSQTVYGDTQVQVKFIRLIRPDGSSIILPNQPGVDSSGVSGLSGEVDNHWMQLIGASALATVFNIPAVAATAASSQTVCTTDSDGNTSCSPNYGQMAATSALQSMGQTAQQVGGKLTSRAMNLKPTITIPAATQFSIMVTKDTYLPPYNNNEGS